MLYSCTHMSTAGVKGFTVSDINNTQHPVVSTTTDEQVIPRLPTSRVPTLSLEKNPGLFQDFPGPP